MTLRRFNHLLTLVVIAVASYLILAPFLPQLAYMLSDKSPEVIAPYQGSLADGVGNSNPLPVPADNRLVIPDIGINEPILEGTNIGVISKGGTWRRPNTSEPTADDNTVIIGHRFFGSDASTFYNLDKVDVGQRMALYWEGKEIVYEVTEVKVVNPSAVEIEAPTTEKQLTLYTCTPIWTARDRLVVIAKPVDTQVQDNVSDAQES